jgi:DNA-directed RNA polymerase subunit M/transcription elongation factor TFIIS
MPLQRPAENQASAALFCKFCGNIMALKSVEPSRLPDHDHITYECSKCGHRLSKDVRYR